MRVSARDIERAWDALGTLRGWDFSKVRDARGPTPWDYDDVVRAHLRPEHRVLDVGTGGGERFIGLASEFRHGVGVDAARSMLGTARDNASRAGAHEMTFALMDAAALAFGEASFDVVLTRHVQIHEEQIARVLRPGGLFITQEVGYDNTLNIWPAFGWDREAWGWDTDTVLAALVPRLRDAGFHIRTQCEYDVPYMFLDLESFLFWIRSVPFPEEVTLDAHGDALLRFVRDNSSADGIHTNEQRILVVAEKVA
ncbi:class I SAM-dependent methyltransferase [Candidatus Poribacteria bacterium]|jgi:SAM-dependent methyltransferase|nr:class I SAM-dependent methyltransferase [Candidatus Poribacteria bacterium]MBT5533030.1 class I SAM-dependent methyltransferase [Candidatus Poribacteria bacterium]MBT5711794.1 class I SAM-dependent methyltransferase [Candidatus Poribacteria bacterium]MBT7097231.1 class I SAM-dependent methyltransferase [Candidatus Poribacteria bacterium]MBT7808086.1 class I SAM-dependent methyltransferase [Candidatus Poribacteria bacterium]